MPAKSGKSPWPYPRCTARYASGSPSARACQTSDRERARGHQEEQKAVPQNAAPFGPGPERDHQERNDEQDADRARERRGATEDRRPAHPPLAREPEAGDREPEEERLGEVGGAEERHGRDEQRDGRALRDRLLRGTM